MKKNPVKTSTVKIGYDFLKNHSFSGLTFRIWEEEDIYDKYFIDSKTIYVFRDYNEVWYLDPVLRGLYDNQSHQMFFKFYSESLPKRCSSYLDKLTLELKDRLELTRSKISIGKVKCTVKFLLKHISRLKFHSGYVLTFSSRNESWIGSGNISKSYFLELLEMLKEDGKIKVFDGFFTGTSCNPNISSMILLLPSFIDRCNGFSGELLIDDCLRKEQSPPVELRVKVGSKGKSKKGDIKVVKPKREELTVYRSAERILNAYNDALKEVYVVVNGVYVPEVFFRRIFNDDMHHGGRFYDDGAIQGKSSQERSTILIDGLPTIERDYSNLHYAICADELGIDLKDKDPYNFPLDIEVNQSEVDRLEEEFGITHYNPVRNIKKTALLVMFNAKNENAAWRGLNKAVHDDYNKKNIVSRRFVGLRNIPSKQIITAVKEHNQAVSSFFCSGVGTRLQNLDSKMMEYCVKKFLAAGEVMLPVHDSIVCRRDLKDFCDETMTNAYEHVVGSKLNCKIK